MDTIRSNVSVDIGFGDEITAGPVEMDFPVILDSAIPKIKVYSLESAIAEKFEAIVKLNILTSRMKDFYDIFFIASNKSFKSETLRTAINNTFKNRGTKLEDRNSIYADSFKKDAGKQSQWSAYLKKNNLDAAAKFEIVIDNIQEFIEPVFERDASKEWDSANWKWK